MKLHVGCGSIYKPGYVNLDGHDDSVADCLADARALPFADSSAERIESYQLVEHLGFFGAFYHFAECHRVLGPGGVLLFETPDPERSFGRFLECRTRKDRAETLNWIFGHGCDGYSHRYLFPEDALRELLRRSGFTNLSFEEPTTHVYAPGSRVACTKSEDRVYSVLGRLRRSLVARNAWRLPHPIELVEFEEYFIARALELSRERQGGDGAESLDTLLEMACFSPPLALELVDTAAACNVSLSVDVTRLRPGLEWLASHGFTSALCTAFDRLSLTANALTDGYDHIFATGKRIAAELLSGRRPLDRADLGKLTGADHDAPASRRDLPLFSRAYVTARARRWRDRGIKHLGRNELAEAEELLARSINAKIDFFYAVWNMAILKVRTGELERATDYYELALRFEVPGTADVLRRELDALRSHTAGQAAPSESAIRTEPVLVGEHVYARP
jgi:hypothetical protein